MTTTPTRATLCAEHGGTGQPVPLVGHGAVAVCDACGRGIGRA